MATHSIISAWRMPWTEEPGGLQSIGSNRVRLKQLGMHGCTPDSKIFSSLFLTLWSHLDLSSFPNLAPSPGFSLPPSLSHSLEKKQFTDPSPEVFRGPGS